MVGMLTFGIEKSDKGVCPRSLPPAEFLAIFPGLAQSEGTCIVDSVPFAEASLGASFPQKFRAQRRLVRSRGLVLNFRVEHGVLLPIAKTSRNHFSIHTAPGRVVKESRWSGSCVRGMPSSTTGGRQRNGTGKDGNSQCSPSSERSF